MTDTIVIYFSGADAAHSTVKKAAEALASYAGADTYEIVCENPYSTDTKVLVTQALKDKENNARPALVQPLPDMAGYRNILLGFPNWCGTAPMPVFSFMDSGLLNGKSVSCFVVNDGAGLQDSRKDLETAYPQVTFEDFEAVNSSDASSQLLEWIQEKM